ncbi:hypothetical protein [Dapis sp. BLCC M172]|uniref:hypothetical protein n=1 Tax=Dapis sp. BLCC M172 TaxID=2975281 RepID=UPI003CEB5F0E
MDISTLIRRRNMRKISWLLAIVFSVMMMLVAVPSQAMAAEVQLAQAQPSKAEVLAQLDQQMQVAQAQPSKAEVAKEAAKSEEVGTEVDVGYITLCTYCETCGGGWPNFGGINRNLEATISKAYELGTNCSGTYMWRDDQYPYLCCRRFF